MKIEQNPKGKEANERAIAAERGMKRRRTQKKLRGMVM